MERKLAEDTQSILNNNHHNSSVTLPDNVFSIEAAGLARQVTGYSDSVDVV